MTEIDEYKRLLALEKENHVKTKIKLKARERELHSITQSSSYKLARILAKSKHGLKVVRSRIYNLTPARLKLIKGNQRHVKRIYNSEKFNIDFSIKPTSDIAVVIHLYYPDLLSYFQEKLDGLSTINYDLFITLTEKDEGIIGEVKRIFPFAVISVVPNCGRDVLPFLEVVRKIEPLGYKKVLKIHSKKSPHRLDGDLWRDEIVGSLIPKNKTVLKDILTKLDENKTALIGPVDQYMSFLVNFSATSHYMTSLTTKLLNAKTASGLIEKSDEYGFFAGTMFWARVDALSPFLNHIKATDFEPEFGQEDSTLAHALERLFSIIPELERKNMYEVGEKKVSKVPYHTTNIPLWSEIALED